MHFSGFIAAGSYQVDKAEGHIIRTGWYGVCGLQEGADPPCEGPKRGVRASALTFQQVAHQLLNKSIRVNFFGHALCFVHGLYGTASVAPLAVGACNVDEEASTPLGREL